MSHRTTILVHHQFWLACTHFNEREVRKGKTAGKIVTASFSGPIGAPLNRLARFHNAARTRLVIPRVGTTPTPRGRERTDTRSKPTPSIP